MLRINELRQLDLGVQGENEARTITIDVRDWLVTYPNGSVTIWHKRNGDSVPSATGAVMDAQEGTVSWTPTDTDTYQAGEGLAEIRLTEGNVIKKSKEVKTNVAPAVTLAGTATGSDWQSYINAVDGIRAAAVAAQETAEEWATGGESGTPAADNNAKYYAEEAQNSAEDSEAYAIGKRAGQDVDIGDVTYNNNSKYYAEQAGISATAAAGSATAAAGSATSASGSASAASNSASAAGASASAAMAARDKILGMQASATGLPEGSDPTASYNDGLLHLGIPKGDTGTGAYVFIRYAAEEPTQDSDMKTTPDKYMGIYSGSQNTAPVHYTDYTWYRIRGADGTGSGFVAEIKMNGSTMPMDEDNTVDLGTVVTSKSEKADKVSNAISGNFAALDANGNLTDSGHKHSDYATDITGKADKVNNATSGNFAALDANGNLTDSGHKHSDYDISGKADKADTALTTTLSRGRKANTTVGEGSFAFGNNVEASGNYSFSHGNNSIASGVYSHAEGADASYQEGGYATIQFPVASGAASHAEGSGTRAEGINSHSEGRLTIANHKSQHVAGELNVADPSTEASTSRGNYVEIIGNGTANSARSNARALDWDGNEYLAGDLYVNCNDDSTGGTKVLTEHQDITGKADKVTGATNGNLAALDANGNLTDSGLAAGAVPKMLNIGSISTNATASRQIKTTANARFVIFGIGTNNWCQIMVNVTDANMPRTNILAQASNLISCTEATGKLTVATSGTGVCYLYALVFEGSISL